MSCANYNGEVEIEPFNNHYTPIEVTENRGIGWESRKSKKLGFGSESVLRDHNLPQSESLCGFKHAVLRNFDRPPAEQPTKVFNTVFQPVTTGGGSTPLFLYYLGKDNNLHMLVKNEKIRHDVYGRGVNWEGSYGDDFKNEWIHVSEHRIDGKIGGSDEFPFDHLNSRLFCDKTKKAPFRNIGAATGCLSDSEYWPDYEQRTGWPSGQLELFFNRELTDPVFIELSPQECRQRSNNNIVDFFQTKSNQPNGFKHQYSKVNKNSGY